MDLIKTCTLEQVIKFTKPLFCLVLLCSGSRKVINKKLLVAIILSVLAAIMADGWIEQLRLSSYDSKLVSILIGSMPNFIAVSFISIPFLFSRHDYLKSLFGVTIGLCIYEVMQINLAWGRFDVIDILFSILAGITGWMLYLILKRLNAVPASQSRSDTKTYRS